jgi:hypothetical protein
VAHRNVHPHVRKTLAIVRRTSIDVATGECRDVGCCVFRAFRHGLGSRGCAVRSFGFWLGLRKS